MPRELQIRSHMSTLERLRHLIEILAITGAAVWGLYVFVYQERIKPANDPPELQPTFTVEHTALPRGHEFIRVGIGLKNAGQQTLYVAGLAITAYGIRYLDASPQIVQAPRPEGASYEATLASTPPHLLFSRLRPFRPFGNPDNFIVIQPATAYTGALSFAIPVHRFDAVKLQWLICFTKDAARTWTPKVERRTDGSYWFEDVFTDAAQRSGLICYDTPGAFFPL